MLVSPFGNIVTYGANLYNMLSLFEHPNYIYYYSQKPPKEEVLFVNFNDIVFDTEMAFEYLISAFEKLGVSKEIFLDLNRLSISSSGIYNLNTHIDLMYNYLLSRGIKFEDTVSKIVSKFFDVYQCSKNFIREDIRQFINRYSDVVDIILYDFSDSQFDLDKRFSSEICDNVFGNLFIRGRDAKFLSEFQNNVVKDVGYKKVFLMEPSQEIQSAVNEGKTFENFTSLVLPFLVEEKKLSGKSLDSFDFIVF